MHELPIVRSLLSIALRRAAEARAARILALDVRKLLQPEPGPGDPGRPK